MGLVCFELNSTSTLLGAVCTTISIQLCITIAKNYDEYRTTCGTAPLRLVAPRQAVYLRFQIAVDDVETVQIGEGEYNLRGVELALVVGKSVVATTGRPSEVRPFKQCAINTTSTE